MFCIIDPSGDAILMFLCPEALVSDNWLIDLSGSETDVSQVHLIILHLHNSSHVQEWLKLSRPTGNSVVNTSGFL